jgi:hypothetical protein
MPTQTLCRRGPTNDHMAADAPLLDLRDENAQQLAAAWQAVRRRKRIDFDRAQLVEELLAAVGGGAAESIRLATAAAALGASYATAGGSVSSLVEEVDDLDSLLLERIASRTPAVTEPASPIATIRALQRASALGRRSATAAYGHALSTAARKRSRIARHDIANAIGTVRNAILLMEDEASEGSRDHFRAIAKRNSQSSETLVRSHLSDQMALSPALGWEELTVSTSGAVADVLPSDQPSTNMAAVETMLQAIRAVVSPDRGQAADSLTTSFASVNSTSGVLTVAWAMCADQAAGSSALNSSALDALRTLAVALGLRLDGPDEGSSLRLLIPVSARDERNNLGGARQGQHVDAVAR